MPLERDLPQFAPQKAHASPAPPDGLSRKSLLPERGGMKPLMISGGGSDEFYDKPPNAAVKLWRSYQHQLHVRPLVTKAWTSGIIGALGDVLAQFLARSAGVPFSVDVRRLLLYSSVGFIYVPIVIHHWFMALEHLADKSKAENKYQRAFLQLAVDQTIGAVCINIGFYVFYTLLVSAVDGNLHSAHVSSAIQAKLSSEIVPTLKNNWKLWPAANFINFAFVPPHLRLLFSNVVAIFWNIYLSNSAAK